MDIYQTPSTNEPCIVIGAGIAGLTAALAFARFGFSVLVLEKSENLRAVGAGLQLSPNATSILAKLDILNALLPLATVLQTVDFISARTCKLLLSLKTSSNSNEPAPFLSAHRADLQAKLLAKVRLCPSIKIQLGTAYLRHEVLRAGVNVTYQTDFKTVSVRGCCLIGADGVWSSVRERNCTYKSQFSGYSAFRQTVESTQLSADYVQGSDCVKAFVSPNGHLVTYPISQGKRINFVFITRGNKQASVQPSLPNFKGFHSSISQDLYHFSDWSHWPIHTIKQNRRWQIDERTILIGDAAHAMLPFGAQGAGMAIEDAYTLAYSLAQHPADVGSAFEVYEKLRRKRIIQVIKRAKLNAMAYHASGASALARDMIFRVRGQRLMADLAWLYEYRAPGVIPL